MRHLSPILKALVLPVAALALMSARGSCDEPTTPLEKYRKLEFPPTEENFDRGWQDRVALEFEIVNSADVTSLRTALKDKNVFVRAIAARALGIRSDNASADALAELVKSDPEYVVRIRAIESLGYLKMKPEIIELAKKDRQLGVQWVAPMAAGYLESDVDYAGEVRRAFAAGIKREAMGSATVGQTAPDFTALTADGKPFKLSSALDKKKPVAIYFAAFDG